MAEKRMLNKVISISKKVNLQLKDHFSRLLYTWMIPHSDDFGRMTGDPYKLRALVIPMLDESASEVERALTDMHNAGLIHWYNVDGEQYIKINNFEEHQSGLHKRTKSKFPEPPAHSGKFPDIPLEGKGTEQKRTEEKGIGTEGNGNAPSPPLSNPHIDHIHNLCKQCGITKENHFTLDQITSFVGAVDIEVVEAAIKKSSGKSMQYVLATLEGMVNRDGITKKEQLEIKVKPSQNKQRNKPAIVTDNVPDDPISDEEYEEILKNVRLIDQRLKGVG